METISHPAYEHITLELVLKALGDNVRLSIVKQLLAADGAEKACGTFDYTISKATFSHHLKILRDAGVVRTRQEGTRRLTSLRRDELEEKFPGLLEMVESTS